jgi:hypothetical protein
VRRLLAVAVGCALLLPVASASAHQGNPNFRSDVRGMSPATPGVTIDVLNRDDRLLLTNRSAKTVEIEGYEGEPYARVLPDGSVQVNRNSPATYLNEERDGDVPVPPNATKGAPVEWTTQSKTGKFEWHDHRFHWMGTGTPPAVKDTSKLTKVNDWAIPVKVDGQDGAITGTLYWTPKDDSGAPIGAIAALVALALLGAAFVVVVRRRRRRGPPPAGSAPPEPRKQREAW